MTGYTTVFGNQPIYSAQPSLLALALAADTTLDWPLETIDGPNVLATIIDVTPDAPGRSIILPDATQGTPGYAVTFTNLGVNTFTVKDATGATVLNVASGLVWTLYLRTNTTIAGTWRAFQQGAGSSSADAASLAGSGMKAIATTLNTKFEVSQKSANFVIRNQDRAVIMQWTGGAGQFTLPDPAVVGSDWYCGIKNSGAGAVTVVPTSGLVDSSASVSLSTGESAFFYTDGTNFFTVGLGQEINSSFDFISISVAGTGDFTLSGVQLNRISYRFTGVLTGNRNVIVPASIQQYWVDNETTGAFTLTVKTPAGTGKTVTQGNRSILYCDGVNVLDADSALFTPPLAVASGGTGATTAANARANLGSTTIGDAVFIAVSAAAARSTIGAVADTRSITGTNSVTGGGDLTADRTLALVNDTGSPGGYKVYGTNSAGTKGWQTPQNVPMNVNSQSGNYTAVAGDANSMILHPSGGGAGDTFTIPANASVAYDVGTQLMFVNDDSNSLALAITTDTLTVAGTSQTGARTIAPKGMAVATKITSSSWLLSGIGIT